MVPVGFTYAWVAWTECDQGIALVILGVCLFLVVICLLVLRSAKNSLPVSDFKASSIEAADHENTAFLLLYVMPLFTSQFNSLDWHFWIPTLIIFTVITATGYNYHFNPMLGLMGWHFYKVQSAEGVMFILITKKQIRTAATNLRVGQLTEYMLLDLGGR